MIFHNVEGTVNSHYTPFRPPARLMILVVIAAFCMTWFLESKSARAQTMGTGAIEGTVEDSQGSLVQGAAVTVNDPKTGYTVTEKTNASGVYRLDALPPSTYAVSVLAPGFGALTYAKVIVDAMAVVSLDCQLKTAAVVTQVTVSSAPPQLDQSNGTLETTLENQVYTELPLDMSNTAKNPLGFITLVPGTQTGGFQGFNLSGAVGETGTLYINGMPVASSELQGDARPIKEATSTETVDQFQLLTTGIPAYYEGMGATNLIMRSGTNQFHGDVYENVRNTDFDAAGYFSKAAAVERQNEYGGTLGGPILRNRLFFFFNYDGYRYTAASTPTLYSIPTPAEQQGDFSALLASGGTLYDPATTTCNGSGVCTRETFTQEYSEGPGSTICNGDTNCIPTNRITAPSQYLESFLPKPINSGVQSNYLGFVIGGNIINMYHGVIDYQLSKSNHVTWLMEYGRTSPVGLPSDGGPVLPEPYTSTDIGITPMGVQQVTDTETITPHLINMFGFQYNSFGGPSENPTTAGDYTQKSGLQGIPSGYASEIFPPVSFSGPNSPTQWAGYTFSTATADIAHTFSTQDNVQWLKGRHSFTFGGQIIKEQENDFLPNRNQGFNFTNDETAGISSSGTIVATTGNGYASFLLGDVDSATMFQTAVPYNNARYSSYAAYAQDDWKLTRNLMINLGIRYDLPKPYTETDNRESWLNATQANPAVDNYPGALQFAGSGTDGCNCSSPVQTHYLQFSPRVGFAYGIRSNLVIRGSYSFIRFNGGALGGNSQSTGTGLLGYTAQPTASSPNGGIAPAYVWTNPFPSYTAPPFFSSTLNSGYNTTTGPTGGTVEYPEPATAGLMPHTNLWNLTLQHQLTPTILYSLSYVGNLSRRVPTFGGYGEYTNQMNPKYLVLGSLLRATETSTTLAEAQAIISGIQVPYANFSGTIGQMLLPFPQYTSINDFYADDSKSNYNALQVYVQKNMSSGLYFLVDYTWSKQLDNSMANMITLAGTAPRSSYNLRPEYAVDVAHDPQVVNLTFIYGLPFGRGKALGGSVNPALDAMIGGWQLSGILTYNAGAPLGPFTAACNVPYENTCYADYNPNFAGSPRINGGWGSGTPKSGTSYINVGAFQNPAAYTFGTTSRTEPYKLTNPWAPNENLALQKQFNLFREKSLTLRADAFNVFNRTVFGGINTTTTSTAFGRVASQANTPRQLQFESYIRF